MIEYNSAILEENEVSTHLKTGEILNCIQYWWLKEVSLKGYVPYNSVCIMLSQIKTETVNRSVIGEDLEGGAV